MRRRTLLTTGIAAAAAFGIKGKAVAASSCVDGLSAAGSPSFLLHITGGALFALHETERRGEVGFVAPNCSPAHLPRLRLIEGTATGSWKPSQPREWLLGAGEVTLGVAARSPELTVIGKGDALMEKPANPDDAADWAPINFVPRIQTILRELGAEDTALKDDWRSFVFASIVLDKGELASDLPSQKGRYALWEFKRFAKYWRQAISDAVIYSLEVDLSNDFSIKNSVLGELTIKRHPASKRIVMSLDAGVPQVGNPVKGEAIDHYCAFSELLKLQETPVLPIRGDNFGIASGVSEGEPTPGKYCPGAVVTFK